jgi:hypothetical protein
MTHFQLQRYCYSGAYIGDVCKPVAYSLELTTDYPYSIDAVRDYKEGLCHVHGSSCIGHMEHYGSMLFLPSWMTPPSKDIDSALFVLKNKCINGRISYDVYVKAVLSMLRGKSGYVRSVSKMSVQGSMRMVISPARTCSDRCVYIPRYMADKCIVPLIEGEHYCASRLSDCRYVILVRQPCMWTGGIQPVELKLTEADTDDGTQPDVNCSLQLPLDLCIPYGADFDGDEMTVFGLRGHQAETECSAFAWGNNTRSLDNHEDYMHVAYNGTCLIGTEANTTAICTTICWSDRFNRTKITPVHTKWLTSKSSVISMTSMHKSAKDLASAGMFSMNIACSKSSAQSDVGASTRRSRIGSSRVHLDVSGIPMFGRQGMSIMCRDPIIYSINKVDGWFGNPTIRAVSKLCSSVMQLTLKVKSMNNIENLSPTLSLLSGATSWLIIESNGQINVHTMNDQSDFGSAQTICSLYEISHAAVDNKIMLIKQFVDIVLVECRRTLDIAEYECLVLLLYDIVKTTLKTPIGIQTVIGLDYPEFSSFAVFSASYVDMKFARSYGAYKSPCTVAEHMLIRHFEGVPSIV